MKWNTKTTEQAEEELSKIEKEPHEKQYEPLKKWIDKYGVSVFYKYSPSDTRWKQEAFENAHRFLQTKMMLNACTTARSSCKWAAIAAIVASIGVITSWYVILLKMIFQILKGI